MKITDIQAEVLELKLLKPIKIALGTIEDSKTVIVTVKTDRGITGIGESSPYGPVTGESVTTVLDAISAFRKLLIGADPLEIPKINYAMDRLLHMNTAAKAGIDMALYDIYAKNMELPLYKALGGERNSFVTDKTIGIGSPEEMLKEALEIKEQGFGCIKIKAGLDWHRDLEIVAKLRENLGHDIGIRIDANQGWTASDAVRIMNLLDKYEIDAVEQPVPYYDLHGLAAIREKVGIPVMADESLFSPQDALSLIRSEAVDLFNIKLMKSGGIWKARAINSIAEAAGIQCMVGCMMESRLGITAAAHLVAACRNITRADIDSLLHIKDDGLKGGLSYNNGRVVLQDNPGIGVSL